MSYCIVIYDLRSMYITYFRRYTMRIKLYIVVDSISHRRFLMWFSSVSTSIFKPFWNWSTELLFDWCLTTGQYHFSKFNWTQLLFAWIFSWNNNIKNEWIMSLVNNCRSSKILKKVLYTVLVSIKSFFYLSFFLQKQIKYIKLTNPNYFIS